MLTRLKQHLPFPAHSFVLFCCCGCFLFSFSRNSWHACWELSCLRFFLTFVLFFSSFCFLFQRLILCRHFFFYKLQFYFYFCAQFKTLQCVPTIKSLSYVIFRNNASICLLQHLCDICFISKVCSFYLFK